MSSTSNSNNYLVANQVALLDQQAKLVDHLAQHAHQLINVYKANESGYTNRFSVDWSEIFGYCFPVEDAKKAFDRKGKIGYEETLRADLADAFLFSMANNIILLPPHLVELRGAVSRLTRSGVKQGVINSELVDIWKKELNRIKESPYIQEALRQFKKDQGKLSPETILRIVKYHMKDSYIIVQLISGGWAEGIRRLRLLGENDALVFWNQIFKTVLDETILFNEGLVVAQEIAKVRSGLKNKRLSTIDQRDYLDGVATEYVREINKYALPKKQILFFLSRAETMKKVVAERLRVHIDLGDENVEIETFWSPDRFIAYEVFRDDENWTEAQNRAKIFCETTGKFLSLIRDLRHGRIDSPDPSTTLKAALTQFGILKNDLEKFENLRLARVSPIVNNVGSESNLQSISTNASSKEFIKFIGAFFNLLETTDNLQMQIQEAVESLLSEIDAPGKVIEEVLGAGKEILSIDLDCSISQKNGQEVLVVRGWIKQMPLVLHFHSDSGKEKAVRLVEALKSSLVDGFNYFVALIINKENLEKEERLIISMVYAALSNTNQAKMELIGIFSQNLGKVTAEARYLSALIDMALSNDTQQLNSALTNIELAIEINPAEAEFYFTKSIALWRIARQTQNAKMMGLVIDVTDEAKKLIADDKAQMARYYNNMAYWEVELASSFAQKLTEDQIRGHLSRAREYIDLTFQLCQYEKLDGDYHHTMGKILLTQLKLETDPDEAKILKDRARREFQISADSKVASWNGSDLRRDLFDLTSYF